jgi:hypothetical protein
MKIHLFTKFRDLLVVLLNVCRIWIGIAQTRDGVMEFAFKCLDFLIALFDNDIIHY